ncbi:MAG TPA: hypothetical protein DEA96_11405 [Leptospiraceae bacterium]|nr:hypothetical protein [Spirochaetaceae bacterium]HBS05566.1 hypothetical protein [Leptospiraceae bacterium]|tara:strand:- start:1225 stop:2865 length:1641 start_codon:yes stop_codon:yes gene_type:complete
MKSYAGFLAYRIKMETSDFLVTEVSDLPLIADPDSEGQSQSSPTPGLQKNDSGSSGKASADAPSEVPSHAADRRGKGSRSAGKKGIGKKESNSAKESVRKRGSGSGGAFSVYALEKDGWNTVDAIQKAARQSGISTKEIHYGGKKDRHARTIQWLTVKNGGDLSCEESGYSIRYLGRSSEPMGPEHILGNRFRLVIRNILERETSHVLAGARRLQETGFPNYFDDQRFGSFHPLIGFPFLSLLRGDPESALRFTLLSAFGGDKPHAKRRKKAINDNWGNWDECLKLASTKTESAILGQLKSNRCKAGDSSNASQKQFLELLDRLPREDLSMGFSALQSWIFNESVARLFRNIEHLWKHSSSGSARSRGFRTVEIKTKTGDQTFPISVESRFLTLLDSMDFMLIGPGQKSPARSNSESASEFDSASYSEDSCQKTIQSVLKACRENQEATPDSDCKRLIQMAFLQCERQVTEVLEIPEQSFHQSFLKNAFLKSHSRPLWCIPQDMQWSDFSVDELNKGKLKYTVEFTLPRGVYATMAIKMLHLRLKQ